MTNTDSGLPREMDEVIEELSLIQYEFAASSDKMKITSKDDIKLVVNRSTDMSDALAMTFYETKAVQTPEDIAKLKRKLFK